MPDFYVIFATLCGRDEPDTEAALYALFRMREIVEAPPYGPAA